jgi:hypothetical protein
MAPTVEEILKQSGLSDDAIKALDAKIVSGFTTVLRTAAETEAAAAQAKEAAEIARRAQQQQYETQIAPALDKWGSDQANLIAERDFYRTQNEQARGAGFVPKEAPTYKPGTTPANPSTTENTVPGSPRFLTADAGIAALSNATWMQQEHFRLYGTMPPDELYTLMKEANDRHLGFKEYVEQKYKFPERRTAIATEAKNKELDAVRAETRKAVEKELAEKFGNNPNVRVPSESSFATIHKGVESGTRKDPLSMTQAQRREYTRQNIQSDLSSNSGAA